MIVVIRHGMVNDEVEVEVSEEKTVRDLKAIARAKTQLPDSQGITVSLLLACKGLIQFRHFTTHSHATTAHLQWSHTAQRISYLEAASI